MKTSIKVFLLGTISCLSSLVANQLHGATGGMGSGGSLAHFRLPVSQAKLQAVISGVKNLAAEIISVSKISDSVPDHYVVQMLVRDTSIHKDVCVAQGYTLTTVSTPGKPLPDGERLATTSYVAQPDPSPSPCE